MSELLPMPALGESVDEATVTRWLKQPGDRVEEGEVVAEVSTDKVDTEITSPFAGVFEQILVAEGETVPLGTALASIGVGEESGAAAPGTAAPAEAPTTEAPAVAVAEPAVVAAPPVEPAPVVTPLPAPPAAEVPTPAPSPRRDARRGSASGYLSFLVRRLVEENGIDVSTIRGTGANGRVRKQDVLPLLSSRGQGTAPSTVSTLYLDVDLGHLVDAHGSPRPDLLASLALSVLETLRSFPLGSVGADAAVSVEVAAGATVVVSGAPTLEQIAAQLSEGAQSQDSAALAIVNPGASGVQFAASPVLSPRSVVLSLGAVQARPVVVTLAGAQAVAIRSLATLGLSSDTRLIDGAEAAAFLGELKARVESVRPDGR